MSEHATRLSIAAALADGLAKLKNAASGRRILAVPARVLDFCAALAASPEMVAVLADPLVSRVARDPRVLRQFALLLRLGVHTAPAHATEAIHAVLGSRELAEAIADPAVALLLRDPNNLRELAQLLRVAAHAPASNSPAAN